jgi:hypothetical protein
MGIVSAMTQLWPRRTAMLATICALFGCSGQVVEGRWRGPFPLEDAKVCVLNLYSNRHFDLACGANDWVGSGRYHVDSDKLTFDFELLLHRSERVRPMPVLSLRLEGHGNEITLLNDAGQQYRLSRHVE